MGLVADPDCNCLMGRWPAQTHILKIVWLHEVDWLTPADCMFKRLAKAWRTALRKSDAVLHIDAEFTRPGMIALCEDW